MTTAGLAKSIRECTSDEETFDLGGYTEAMTAELMKAAFGTPMERNDGLKATLVVGGGKLVRQKYDDNLTKFVTKALSELGFEEDRSADKSARGCYKTQHDTSKNLKFVHVFPYIVIAEGEDGEEEEGRRDLTVEERLLHADKGLFDRMVSVKVESYTQRKRLLAVLKDAEKLLAECEKKLIERGSLNREEQDAYDNYTEVSEKVQWLQKDLQAMMENGGLEEDEKTEVLQTLTEKLDSIKTEIASADGKKKAKWEAAKASVEATKEKVKAADVLGPRPLKREKQLKELYKSLATREALDKQAGSKTIAEMRLIGEIPELQEAIEQMENESRMWFEEDEEFQKKVKRCKQASKPKKVIKTQAAAGWSTVSAQAKPTKSGGKPTKTKNAFAALDSD